MSIILRKSFEYNENSFYQITCKKDVFQAVSPWVYGYSELTKQNIPILLQSDTFPFAIDIKFKSHNSRNCLKFGSNNAPDIDLQIKILKKIDYARILIGLIEDDKVYEETKKFWSLEYSNICKFDHSSIEIKKVSYATELSPEEIFEFGLKIKEPNFIFYNFLKLINEKKYSIDYLNNMIQKTVDYFAYLIPKNTQNFLQFCVDFQEKYIYIAGTGLKSPCNWESFGLYISFLYVYNETKNFRQFLKIHYKTSIKTIFSVFLKRSFDNHEIKIIKEFIIKYPEIMIDLIDLYKCFDNISEQQEFKKFEKFLDMVPDPIFNIKFFKFFKYQRNEEQYKYLMERLKKQKDNKKLIKECILNSLQFDNSCQFLFDILENSIIEKPDFFLKNDYVDKDLRGHLIEACQKLNINMGENLICRYFYQHFHRIHTHEFSSVKNVTDFVEFIENHCKKWSIGKILDNLFELIESEKKSFFKNSSKNFPWYIYRDLFEKLSFLRKETIPLDDYNRLNKNYPDYWKILAKGQFHKGWS